METLAFLVTASLSVFFITITLNLALIFPFSGVRQHLFAAPLIVPLIAVGIIRFVRQITVMLAIPWATNGLIFLLVCAIFAMSTVSALSAKGNVSHIVDELEASGAPVWAYYGAKQIIRTLSREWVIEKPGFVEGLLPNNSSKKRWVAQARYDDDTGMLMNYYREAAESISRHDRLWLVFSNLYFDVARTEALEVFLHHARGPHRDCAIWMSIRNATLVAFCGPEEDVVSMRDQVPGDVGAHWRQKTQTGDWLNHVKGQTGITLREEDQSIKTVTGLSREE